MHSIDFPGECPYTGGIFGLTTIPKDSYENKTPISHKTLSGAAASKLAASF